MCLFHDGCQGEELGSYFERREEIEDRTEDREQRTEDRRERREERGCSTTLCLQFSHLPRQSSSREQDVWATAINHTEGCEGVVCVHSMV